MDIRSGLDGLKSLLGVDLQAQTSAGKERASGQANAGVLSSDRATLSSAGSQVARAGAADEVRTGKVAAVQSALAAGTYKIPSSAVASKVIDSMLRTNK